MTSRPDSGEDILVDAVVMVEPVAEAVAQQRPEVPVEAAAAPDERLLAAHDLARAALTDITPAATVGDPVGYTVEPDGVVSLRFENQLGGYPGWFWTVSLARVDDGEPSVLEVELLPGEGALVAPEWIPWAVRLADYHAQQLAAAEASALLLAEDATDVGELEDDDLEDDELEDDDLDDLDDVDDLDALDFVSDGSPILHSGDVDGVDIDELADDEDLDDEDLDDDELDDEDELADDDELDEADLEEDLDDEDLDDDDLGDEDDEEDDMTEAIPQDRDPIPDEEFVSDEDDLGEGELQDDGGDDTLDEDEDDVLTDDQR